MASLRGMSLIEVLVVIGMLSLVIAGGAVATANDLTISSNRDDRDRLLDALLRARTRSMLDTSVYGVHTTEYAFTVFRGESFDARDPQFDFALPRSRTHMDPEDSSIVFSRGFPANPVQYALDHRTIVEVSERGRISSLRP